MEQGMYLMAYAGSNALHRQPTTLCVGVMENINNNYRSNDMDWKEYRLQSDTAHQDYRTFNVNNY